MPVYEYQCKACGRDFEYQQRMSDPDKTTCEACGGELDRLISRTAFSLKGGGWYKDLYASPKPDGGGDKSGKSEPKSDGGGDAKTADKPAAKADAPSSSSSDKPAAKSDSGGSSSGSGSSGTSGSGGSSGSAGGSSSGSVTKAS